MEKSVWLAVAAIVISAVSVTIAGWQARNARIQADSARRHAVVAEQKLIDDHEERAESRRETKRKAIQQVVEHAHRLIDSAESVRGDYLRNGPRLGAGHELTQQHTQVLVSAQTSAMLYGDDGTNEAIQEVARRAVTLYNTVMKGIGRGWSTGFVFGSRSFLESTPKPEPFDLEREKSALRSAVNDLVEVASA